MEIFISGYCRAMDGARTVMADAEDGYADCAWPECVHCPQCTVAAEIQKRMAAEEPK